jgi:hypothetical protein
VLAPFGAKQAPITLELDHIRQPIRDGAPWRRASSPIRAPTHTRNRPACDDPLDLYNNRSSAYCVNIRLKLVRPAGARLSKCK